MTVFLAALAWIVFAYQNCNMNAGGPKTDNPIFGLEVTDLDAFPGISKISLCIETIRVLYQAELGLAEGNYVIPYISIDQITLEKGGTDLQNIDVPAGTYEQLEIDLDAHCASARSLEIDNSNGSFSTDTDITLVFKGTVLIDKSLSKLQLEIDYIADRLKDVNADSEIRLAAETRFGRLY